MLVFHEWDLKTPRPDALHVSMYTVREHQTRVNCQTRILYLCYTSGLCLCLCHKNIPRYKYTNHMIYMYIICIIWNVYFTVNTLYLVICSIVPPILKYNSNPISEKTLAETKVFKSDKIWNPFSLDSRFMCFECVTGNDFQVKGGIQLPLSLFLMLLLIVWVIE